MREITIGAIVIRIHPDTHRVVTVFPDGVELHACPEDNDEYGRRALDLGYTGPDAAWTMCQDHELSHSYLSVVHRNEPWSWVLWDVAHGSHHLDAADTGREESRVLAFQQALVKDRPRPWDRPTHPSRNRIIP